MPCDAEDDEAIAGDGTEGHDGDQEVLQRERKVGSEMEILCYPNINEQRLYV